MAGLWMLLLGLAASAQGTRLTHNPLSGYTSRVWKTSDGLPEQIVQAFAQTPDGYLWIGTSGGLLRFDGARFVAYTQDTLPAMAENSVFCLTTSRDGSLWIGMEGGGLMRWSHGIFHHFSAQDGLTDGFVRVVFEDSAGAIWIGTDNGLFRLASAVAERMDRVDDGQRLQGLAVHAIAQEPTGPMWVGGSRLLTLGAGGRGYALAGKSSENRVKSILRTSDGTVWVGTVAGLERMLPGTSDFVAVQGIQGTVRVLRETSDGTLWIGTIGLGAFTFRGGVLSRVKPYVAPPSDTILSVFEDTARNIWLGTQAGMERLSRTPATLVPLNGASDFETISADTDGSLWVASTHLYHLIDGVAHEQVFREANGARVRQVFRDRDGALWLGTDGRGLLRVGASPLHYTTANGLSNNFIRSLIQTQNGDLWAATDEGVTRIRNGICRKFEVQDGLAYFSMRALAEDRAGGLWIGTDRGLSHLVGERFVEDAATRALRNEKVWAIHESDEGTLWFGTRSHGLFRMKDGVLTQYTTANGLASDSIYSILEGGGRFWLGGPNGISAMTPTEFDHPAGERIAQVFYAMSNAGEIAPLYGGTQPAAAVARDGSVWFPTNKGPVSIRAAGSPATAVKELSIDQVVVDGRRIESVAEIVLPANNSNLEIGYSPLLLGSQEDLRFAYRLIGFDTDWQYASSRRVAYYTNLPAGQYRFVAKVFSRGETGGAQASIEIRKLTVFYLRGWFLSLCVLAAVLVVWAVHRARLRRAHAAFEAVLEERARLAREMHDTLIQGCAGVSVLLEACASAGSEEQGELVGYARTHLATSIDEARQAVWNLRSERTDDFGAALEELAQRTSRESGVDVVCSLEGTRFPFAGGPMHELMMMSREALYNALLHARPTKVRLNAHYGTREFALEIVDDGCGFVPGTVVDRHYGLIGIGERVKQLGGTLKVTSRVAEGTEMQIVVPRQRLDATKGVA